MRYRVGSEVTIDTLYICPTLICIFICRNDPGVGSITTFMQFIFISIYGYSRFGFESQIPKLQYFNIVALFFLVNVLNNIAFDYNIPVPLHMIFRSVSIRLSIPKILPKFRIF